VDLDKELKLCKEFLKEDQRNFHCWNYRRFIVTRGNISNENEILFSLEKIKENFSNYSAFHHRSIYIKSTYSNDLNSLKSILPREFSIIENAIFTEPDDQSAWWYHQFLLKFINVELEAKLLSNLNVNNEEKEEEHSKNSIIGANNNNNNANDQKSILEWFSAIFLQQLNLINSLIELEDNNTKWPMVCKVDIIDFIIHFFHDRNTDKNDSSETVFKVFNTNTINSIKDLNEQFDIELLIIQRKELLLKLIEIDKAHSIRYQYLLKNF
jgi:hypothetical protein